MKEQVAQQIRGVRYIGDAVMRRIDANADGDYADTSDRTLFHITDVQFSSVALIDDVGDLVERVSYDAYGRGRHRPLGGLDGDGEVDGVSGCPGTSDQEIRTHAADGWPSISRSLKIATVQFRFAGGRKRRFRCRQIRGLLRHRGPVEVSRLQSQSRCL